jgi:ABC-2 type transport system permease protein
MIEIYRGTWVVGYREVLRFVRDRSRVLSSLAFPLLFLAIFGAGFSNVIGAMAGGVNLVQFMYPGIIAQSAVITALSAGLSVAVDRQEGFLAELLVAPLNRGGIVLGKAVGATAVALMQALVLLAIAPIVGVGLLDVLSTLVPVVVILSLRALRSASYWRRSCARSKVSRC